MIGTIQDRNIQRQTARETAKRSFVVKSKKKKQPKTSYSVQALTQLSGQAKDLLMAFYKNENGPVDVTSKDQYYLNAETLYRHTACQAKQSVSLQDRVRNALKFSDDNAIGYATNAEQAIKRALAVKSMPPSKSPYDNTVNLMPSKQGRKIFQQSLKESIQKECAITGALAVKSMPRATELIMPEAVSPQAQEKRKRITKPCAMSFYEQVKACFLTRKAKSKVKGQSPEVTRGRSDTYDTMPPSPAGSVNSMAQAIAG